MKLEFLEDKWDENYAKKLDEVDKLRYRSNLLGSDLRLTNFGGGNTSSKIIASDPLTGKSTEVLVVKGSGGDLGSIKKDGFAHLYMDKFLCLKEKYLGKEREDDMVHLYPLCVFGLGTRPASIDTPLHGLLPFKHIDHLHPDWAIALAAAANGPEQLKFFNKQFKRKVIWIPWHRPGYALGKTLEIAIEKNPHADGLILASHGTFSWGSNQRECYQNTLQLIDQLGQFILGRVELKGKDLFGGSRFEKLKNRQKLAKKILPYLRGQIGKIKGVIGNYVDLAEVNRFVNAKHANKLAYHGTSCPDHFIRTKVRPLYVDWEPHNGDLKTLFAAILKGLNQYRKDYEAYYELYHEKNSPQMRDPSPSVVLIPGVGLFSFGKNKKEARITGEFYVNAIHVMEGATALEGGKIDEEVHKGRVVDNYMSLMPKEAFRIEYWSLEDAKIKRQPPEKELSRQIVLVIGAGSDVGRALCFRLVQGGAHVAIADINKKAAQETERQIIEQYGKEVSSNIKMDLNERSVISEVLEKVCLRFGGLDILIDTAAILNENYNVLGEFAQIMERQNYSGSILLINTTHNASKKEKDLAKEMDVFYQMVPALANRYAPKIRINGINYILEAEDIRTYPIEHVVNTAYFLISPKSECISGHIIPVYGKLLFERKI
jgi:rhamnulose-1-phosphate aldolase/alcohol dehydrogenase